MWSLWFAGGLALAQMPPQPRFELDPSPVQRDIAEICLPSLLRVSMHVDRRQPVVGLSAVVEQGLAADPAGKEGVGRLAERLWYRARPGDGPEIRARLQAIGALWTTHRLPEVTIFASEAPSDRLGELLAIEGLRYADPLASITPEVFNQEKEALLVELRGQHRLSPPELALALPAGFYPEGRPVSGRLPTPSSVMALTLDDARAAARAWKPAGTSLIAVGDVTMAALTEAIQVRFPPDVLFVAPDGSRPSRGLCKPAVRARATTPPPPRPSAVITAAPGPVTEPELLIAWALPAAYNAEEPLARLALRFLVRRIDETFVSKSVLRRARFAPECHYLPGYASSALVCSLRLPEGTSPEKLLERFNESIAVSMIPPAAEDAELDRFRMDEATFLSLGVGDPAVLRGGWTVRDLLSNHLAYSPVWYGEATASAVAAKFDAVRAFAGRWLRIPQQVAHVVVPPELSPATVLAWPAKPDWTGLEGEVQRADARPDAWSLPLTDEGHEPVPADAAPLAGPRVEGAVTEVLPGGLRVVIVPQGQIPTVRLAVVSQVPPEQAPTPGLLDWTWDIFQFNREQLPATTGYTQLAQKIEARIYASATRDTRTVTVHTSAGHMEPALWLLRHIVEYVRPNPSGDMRAERRYAAQDAITAAGEDPRELARRARAAHLVGADHPVTVGSQGRILSGAKASDAVMKGFFDHAWSAPQVTLVIQGGVDPQAVLPHVRAQFNTLATRRGAKPGAPATVAVGGQDGALSKGFDARSGATELALACPVGAAPRPEVAWVGLELLQQGLTPHLRPASPLPRGRLDTYGPAGVAEVIADLAPERATAVAATVRTALPSVLAAPPEAVARAADAVARREVLLWADPNAVIERIARWGADIAQAGTAPERIRSVGAEEVRAWLAPCASRSAITLVGPGAATP